MTQTSNGGAGERLLRRAIDRLEADAERITHSRRHRLEDANLVFIAYGITARAARAAVDQLRADGVRAGVLELLTLWPFPEALVSEVVRPPPTLSSCPS